MPTELTEIAQCFASQFHTDCSLLLLHRRKTVSDGSWQNETVHKNLCGYLRHFFGWMHDDPTGARLS
jgi:hypothetical protein